MQKLRSLCLGTIESLATAESISLTTTTRRRRLAPREAPAAHAGHIRALSSVRNYSRHIQDPARYAVMEIVGELCRVGRGLEIQLC